MTTIVARFSARRRSRAAAAVLAAIHFVATVPAVSVAQDWQPVPACHTRLATPDAGLQETDLFARAQQLAREGNFAAAQTEYRALIVSVPGNVDYWFGLAQVQHWSGADGDALQTLGRARELAPDYKEIWKLEWSILAGQNERSARRRMADVREAAQAQFQDASWLDEPDVSARYAFRWEAGADIDRLDNNSADWQRAYVHVDVPIADQHIAYASYAHFERFDLVDTQLGVGASIALTDSWHSTLDAQFSSSPAFLPEAAIAINLSRSIGRNWAIGAGVGNRHYAESDVFGAAVSVEHYAGNFRIAYLAQLAQLDASPALTHRATINYYADRGSQYGLSIAGGEEVESVGAAEVLRTDVFAIVLSGRHPLGHYLSIIWRLGFHRQGDFYDRYTTGLSIAGGH